MRTFLQFLLEANWIAKATQNKGGLHRALGVPAGKKIPVKKLAAGMKRAERTGNTSLKRKINLARELKGFNK